MSYINEYIHGKKIYSELLSTLRSQFHQLFDDFEIENSGGIIGVNSHVKSDNQLFMQVFPLCVETCLRNIPPKYQKKITSTINRSRPYNVFFHYKNINDWEKLICLDHFLIKFDQSLFIKPDKEYLDINTKIKWKEAKQLSEGSRDYLEKINLWDLLYFDQIPNDFIAIPLPILSTPTIIVVIKNTIKSEDLKEFLREVYFRTRETVHAYVYNRLISNLTGLIHDKSKIIHKIDSLDRIYINELSQVLLPVSYKYQKEKVEFTKVWPIKNKFVSIDSKLELNLKGGKVLFELTSYHFPKSRKSISTDWIHKLGTYELSLPQIKTTLENIYGLIFEQWQNSQQIKQSAKKSAMSAIMARNMSHNIGHVLTGLKEYINYTEEEFDTILNFLDIQKHKVDLRKKKLPMHISDKEKKRANHIIGLLKKIDHTQGIHKHLHERMEFIADINMAKIFMYSVLNFSDIISSFKSNSKFLEFLSGGATVSFTGVSRLDESQFDDIYAGFANDLMGVQAFYVILENIIRNSIKHSSLKSDSSFDSNEKLAKVKYSIYITDMESGGGTFYCLDIVDNLGEENISKRSDNSYGLLYNIQSKLDEDFIDSSTNEIRSGGWGLIEMRIAASYLTDEVHNYNNLNKYINEPIISVNYYDSDGNISDNNFNLGYRLFIPKPKLALIIINNTKEFACGFSYLNKFGIHVISLSDINNTTLMGSVHQFLITPEGTGVSNINQRIITLNSNEIESLFKYLSSDNYNIINEYIWGLWSKSYKSVINIQIDKMKDGLAKDSVAFFDNHGKEFGDQMSTLENENTFYYYESYNLQSYTNTILKKLTSQQCGDSIYNELLEVIQTKVVIIDERIQKACDKYDTNISNLKVIQVLYLMGIEVPFMFDGVTDNGFVLPLDSYLMESERYNAYLENYIINLLKDSVTRFIIIHLTIFEKLCLSKEKEDISAKLDSLYNLSNDNFEKTIILISGRGTPSNLPDNCYYLNYSIIQNYIIYKRSKFSLVKALYSVRK